MSFQLSTPRLILREFGGADAPHLFALNADPEVLRYTGDPPFESLSKASAFVDQYDDYRENGMGRWAVIRQSDGAWLGWCGLKKHSSFVDIGFRFHQVEWGKGYATESARACLAYGFKNLHLNEIVGRAMPENESSIAVLKKLGMRYLKTDNCEGLHNAHWYMIHRNEYSLMGN